MAVLSPLEIYQVARAAGFDPHEAVTWTAIALAESGGRTTAHAGSGEDSYGLWQVNVASGVRGNRWGDLSDPLTNARAAYEISRHGTDMSPWTVTHDSHRGGAGDYRRYLPQVERLTGLTGDGRGVHGYGAGAGGAVPAGSAALPAYDRIGVGAPVGSVDADADGLTDEFERVAGTDRRAADSDRDGLSDGFEGTRSHTDPLSADTDGDRVPDAVEWARGSDAGHLAGVAGVAGVGQLRESVRGGVHDADRDGLSDRLEGVLGSDPQVADTDHDRLSDAAERALGTGLLSVDTDGDGLTDGLEVRLGQDPLHAPGGGLPPDPTGSGGLGPGGPEHLPGAGLDGLGH